MAITAAMVKELRELTGAGMMDCKKALGETDGNMDEAVEYLRKNGQAKAEKKAGRIAAEGLCTVVVKDDKTAAVVEELKEKNLLKESEGAMIVDLDEYDMAPCLVMKKDGSSIYATRDLAAIFYRKKEYNFDKCIYVTGLEQKLHFAQVFKVVELMGYEWAKENLIHVPYGLVSLEGGKLSTISGNIV